MFRDGSMDSVKFQQKIQYYRFLHSCTEKHQNLAVTKSNNKQSIDRNSLKEVPTIAFFRDQVNLCTDAMNIRRVQSTSMSWNSMFHNIVKICKLECDFPPWVMPS